MGRLIVLVALAACSGKGKATGEPHVGDSALGSGSSASADAVLHDAHRGHDAPPATGDIAVRVEWQDVPVKARSSPGLTACKTPRDPSVAPTTTWGIPDVLVFVDQAPVPEQMRVVLSACALAPRIASAGSLSIASALDHPSTVTVARRGSIDSVIGGTLDPAKGRTVQLPIAGHAVTLTLDAASIYEISTTDPRSESAWVASGAAVTDASGVATVTSLAPGEHQVVAWLPPRAGQPARLGRGTVTVEAGDVADLTVQLDGPP